MGYELGVSLRYIKSKKKQRFVSIITLLSIIGIMVGVMALIIVLSVMTGFEDDLRGKILGTNAHIVVLKFSGGMDKYSSVSSFLKYTMKKDINRQYRVQHHGGANNILHTFTEDVLHDEKLGLADQIEGVTPFIYSQAMLSSHGNVTGVVLRGIDPTTATQVTDLSKKLIRGSISQLAATFKDPESNARIGGIIIGKELARSLGVDDGDTVNIISPLGIMTPLGMIPRMKKFRVVGIFSTGMYEYDSGLAYLSLKNAQQFLNMGDNVTGLEIKIKDIFKARQVARLIQDELGFPYYARSWEDTNRNLFTALKLEKTVMFIILILIIMVGALGIVSSLVMVVVEKTRDIAILKALGATDKSIMKIFVYQGLFIGFIGTGLGLFFGYILCVLLKHYHFVSLPKDVYYIDTLPVTMRPEIFVMVAVSAIVISFFATIYPSYKASKLPPAETLRYE
ncbi:MAG: ABC transporter permease [Deltaproteobacteria bacterium]|nr:ABC transporter permease [Deltaproteobacteria bacterium]MCL5277637.1 ABC transporter permease [Deltaproteobacteria bacterium]